MTIDDLCLYGVVLYIERRLCDDNLLPNSIGIPIVLIWAFVFFWIWIPCTLIRDIRIIRRWNR